MIASCNASSASGPKLRIFSSAPRALPFAPTGLPVAFREPAILGARHNRKTAGRIRHSRTTVQPRCRSHSTTADVETYQSFPSRHEAGKARLVRHAFINDRLERPSEMLRSATRMIGCFGRWTTLGILYRVNINYAASMDIVNTTSGVMSVVAAVNATADRSQASG